MQWTESWTKFQTIVNLDKLHTRIVKLRNIDC